MSHQLGTISSSELELQTQSNHESWLRKIWRSFVTALVQRSETQIWQTTDRAGHTWWNVYDPNTGETVRLDSDAEVRAWIEQSYYRPARAARGFQPFIGR